MGEFGEEQSSNTQWLLKTAKNRVSQLRSQLRRRVDGHRTVELAGDKFWIREVPLKRLKGWKRYYITQEGGCKHSELKVIEKDNQEALTIAWHWNRVVGPPNIENVTLRVSRVKIPGKVFVTGDWILPDGSGRRIPIKGYAFEYTVPQEGREKNIADIGGVLVTECEKSPEIAGNVLRTYREYKKGVSENNLYRISDLDSKFSFPGFADYMRREYLGPLAEYHGGLAIPIS